MPVISLKNLKKVYKLGDNTVHALRGVALSVGVDFTGALLSAIAWLVVVTVW